jgi:exopolysaccharide biosynthesis protein
MLFNVTFSFSYIIIMAVSFIGGGNKSKKRRKIIKKCGYQKTSTLAYVNLSLIKNLRWTKTEEWTSGMSKQLQAKVTRDITPGTYLRKIAPMASTNIAFYIYYLLIISPGIHVYVYYMVFAKLLQENYLN